MTDQKLISIADACDHLGGIGRTTLWRLVRDGHLEQVHIGRRGFITADSLDAYIESLPPKAVAAARDESPPGEDSPTGWDVRLRTLHESVMAVNHNPPLNVTAAREFDEHPAGRTVDLTQFVREDAMRAIPLVLTLENGTELVGYFLTESEVRDHAGERVALAPTTRSNIGERTRAIRNLREGAL